MPISHVSHEPNGNDDYRCGCYDYERFPWLSAHGLIFPVWGQLFMTRVYINHQNGRL